MLGGTEIRTVYACTGIIMLYKSSLAQQSDTDGRELHEESSDALLLELVVSTGLGIGGRCSRGKPVLRMRELD